MVVCVRHVCYWVMNTTIWVNVTYWKYQTILYELVHFFQDTQHKSYDSVLFYAEKWVTEKKKQAKCRGIKFLSFENALGYLEEMLSAFVMEFAIWIMEFIKFHCGFSESAHGVVKLTQNHRSWNSHSHNIHRIEQLTRAHRQSHR